MKFQRYYRKAIMHRYDSNGLKEVKLYRSRPDGTRYKEVVTLKRGQRSWYRVLLGWNDVDQVRFQAGAHVAFHSNEQNRVECKRLSDNNLCYGIVTEMNRRKFYARVSVGEDLVTLHCSDTVREPTHDDYLDLMIGSPLLIDYLKDNPIPNIENLAFRIEPMYKEDFFEESTRTPLPLTHHVGCIVLCYENTNLVQVESYSDGNGWDRIDQDQIAKWMSAGIFCYYKKTRDRNRQLKRTDFKCLGKLYDSDLSDVTKSIILKEVPFVFREFKERRRRKESKEDADVQFMWNDFLGLVECNKIDFTRLTTLRNLDIVYLDVTYTSKWKGSNPRMVDRYVEQSLRERCSHALQTEDFRRNTSQTSTLISINGPSVRFKELPIVDNPTDLLRITYYPNGMDYEVYLSRVIRRFDEVSPEHPLLTMTGAFRNPNKRYEVVPTEENHEKEPLSFGYISRFSHNPTESFEVTFLNGNTQQYPVEKRGNWMNYGVFVKVTEKEIKNRGYLFPITSRRGERSIAIPAIAYVKPIDGNKEKYGCETVFGNIRIRPDGTEDGINEYNHIEHNSKILLKNLTFENKEWVAEYDNIY